MKSEVTRRDWDLQDFRIFANPNSDKLLLSGLIP
jgi:hypothetical protein